MTREDELHALGRLGGEALAGAVELVGGMHLAVLRRLGEYAPPAASAIPTAHATATSALYTAIAAGTRILPAGVAAALAQWRGPLPKPSHTTVGRFVIPAIHGIWGDLIAERHPILAVHTAVRVDGHDLSLDAPTIAAAFAPATRRVVVFLHGLSESDASWWRRPDGVPRPEIPEPAVSYGDRLRDDGFTPVYLRYNSGLRVSENGSQVAELLQNLLGRWPVPVEEVAMVGHSMGGLVARSACRQAELDSQGWVRRVRTVVTLGTPHLGAPLEKAVHLAEQFLARLDVTEPLSRMLGMRSAGVRDMRFGALMADDWEGHDPDDFLRDTCKDVPFLPEATYYFVAATMTRDPAHPAGHLLGDGLVRYGSAAGDHPVRRIPFDLGDGVHLGGLHHFSLLNHPDVYDVIRDWLTPQTAESVC